MIATTKILASCILLAAQSYNLSPAVLVGIYKVEGGQIGQEVHNSNGSYDLGPMQINTIWLPELAKGWGIDQNTARAWVRDDACTNTKVAAWILRGHLDRTGDLATAVAHYNSRTPHIGAGYHAKVRRALDHGGLLRD